MAADINLKPGQYQITHATSEMTRFNVHWIDIKGQHEGVLVDYATLFPLRRLFVCAGYVESTGG